jgi:hypothetical protein
MKSASESESREVRRASGPDGDRDDENMRDEGAVDGPDDVGDIVRSTTDTVRGGTDGGANGTVVAKKELISLAP